MIDSKIAALKKILNEKNIRHDIEQISDTQVVTYCFLGKDLTMTNLVSFWTLLDDIDFRIMTGFDNTIDCYQQSNRGIVENVVEITSQQKSYSHSYPTYQNRYLPPAKISNTYTQSSQSQNYTPSPTKYDLIPQAISRDVKVMEITIPEKNQFELKSFREDFTSVEIDIIDDLIISCYTSVKGPENWNDKTKDRVFWEASSPSKKIQIVISIEKFKPETYIIKMTYFQDFGKSDKLYLCKGLEDLEKLFYDIGWWTPPF